MEAARLIKTRIRTAWSRSKTCKVDTYRGSSQVGVSRGPECRAVMPHESWRDHFRRSNQWLRTEGGAHEDYPRESWRAESDRPKQRLVTIWAELGGPNEFMTMTVTVANDGSDEEAWARSIRSK
jgi:hypothetical protein